MCLLTALHILACSVQLVRMKVETLKQNATTTFSAIPPHPDVHFLCRIDKSKYIPCECKSYHMYFFHMMPCALYRYKSTYLPQFIKEKSSSDCASCLSWSVLMAKEKDQVQNW